MHEQVVYATGFWMQCKYWANYQWWRTIRFYPHIIIVPQMGCLFILSLANSHCKFRFISSVSVSTPTNGSRPPSWDSWHYHPPGQPVFAQLCQASNFHSLAGLWQKFLQNNVGSNHLLPSYSSYLYKAVRVGEIFEHKTENRAFLFNSHQTVILSSGLKI